MKAEVVAKNSFWSSVDLVISLVFGVVSSVAVARVMGPEKLGHYSYVIWLVGIAGALATFGVPLTTRKYASEYLGKGDTRMAHAVIQLTGRVNFWTSLAVVAMGVLLTLAYTPQEQQTYTLLAVVSLLPTMMLGTFTHANIAAEEFRSNATASLVSTCLNFAGIAIVLVAGWDLPGLTAALLVSRVVDLLLRRRSFIRNYKRLGVERPGLFTGQDAKLVPSDLRQRIIRFCCQTAALQAIEILVWNRPQLWFLKRYCDIREVAYYSTGSNLAERLLLVPQVFASAVGASLMVQYGRDPESVARYAAVAVRYVALIALPLLLGLSAISRPFVSALYGQEYLPMALPLALMSMFGICRASLVPAKQLLAAADEQGFVVRWSLVAAVVNLALSYWWIPQGGAVGAALASGATQLLASSGIWWFVLRRFSFPLSRTSLVRLAVSAVGMAAVVAGIGELLPPVPALIVGILLGAPLFLLLLRLSGSLDAADRDRLLRLRGQVPAFLRPHFQAAVALVAR